MLLGRRKVESALDLSTEERQMRNSMKKSVVGLAVAASLGIAGAAQAAALAEGIVSLNTLTFTDTTGATLTNGTNVTVLSFSTTGNATATLTGFAPANSGTLFGPPLDIGDGAGGGPLICLGGGCGAGRLA